MSYKVRNLSLALNNAAAIKSAFILNQIIYETEYKCITTEEHAKIKAL